MAKEKEVEENARGRRETELAAEPPHVSTRSMTKAMPPKEGPSRFTLDKEGIWTEEATEEEETPAREAPRAKRKKANESPELPADPAEEMKSATTADIGSELIRRAAEAARAAEAPRGHKVTQGKTLKEAARTITAGVTELVRRTDPVTDALAIAQGRIATLEAEVEALRKEPASRPTADENSYRARLAVVEHQVEEMRSLLHRLEEQLQGTEKGEGKEVAPAANTRGMEPGAPSAPSAPSAPEPKGGRTADTEWQTVGRKRRGKKKEAGRKQPAKLIPETGAESQRKTPESGSVNTGRGGGRGPLPRAPRTSAVTITLTDKSSQSYAEVLAAAKDSVSLAELGINTMRMRKTITGGVILEVPEDQGRGKAAALAAQPTRALDPNEVRVAPPFRAAEAWVSLIDIAATKAEFQNTLARESGCKPEGIRLGESRLARNGLGTVWIRGPASAVRKLAQAGKVAIGWSTAKVEAIERRPLQCNRCLGIGHTGKTCTAKEDKGHLCFRCGEPEHQARACTTASPKCLLCEALEAPSVHRMGGPACAPAKKGTKGAARGSTAARGSEKGSPPQSDPKPANKEVGTEEATNKERPSRN
ncbi:translation initiation factor IF-2-like [Bombus vosnesenskii]|uniref:Translation initiation factor IF-2-like n=1 Tax=Bombus vosnesenskii TaxID=207650 RepID=A0A6J3L6N5_9HYME|nr:translation initiation factor IF-2-like [Bombus vosnesenskii]